VELGIWPVCGRFGVSAAWRSSWVWAFLVWRPPQFTYASRMRCRSGAIRRRALSGMAYCLTAVYRLLQCESRQFPRAFRRRGPNRRRLTSPIQQSTRLRLLSILRRLLDASRGETELRQQRRVLRRLGGSRRYSPARLSSTGVSGCENRLRAMYKTGQITYTQLYALSSAAKSRQRGSADLRP